MAVWAPAANNHHRPVVAQTASWVTGSSPPGVAIPPLPARAATTAGGHDKPGSGGTTPGTKST